MLTDLLQYPFVGTYELRKNLTALLEKLKEEVKEVVITSKGKPQAVLMNIEEYLEQKEALKELADPIYLRKLLAAKKEFASGKGIPARKVYQKTDL